MKEAFSVPEINLMCIYGTNDKTALTTELRTDLPCIYDPELRDIYESTINKLEKISEGDFAGIGFFMADEDPQETGA